MAWEKFALEGKDVSPHITLRQGGQIGLNHSAVTLHNLKKYKSVVLFIDKTDRKIGLKFTVNEKEPGARKMRHHEFGATIPAKSFFDHYEIDLTQLPKRRLRCEFDKKEEMLVVKY